MNIISEHFEKENIKNAVQWVTESREKKPSEPVRKLVDRAIFRFNLSQPSEPVRKLVDRAIFRFNLSPADAEFLIRFFHDRAA